MFSIHMEYRYDIKWQVHMYQKISWKLNDVQNMGKFDTAWSLLGNMSRLFKNGLLFQKRDNFRQMLSS